MVTVKVAARPVVANRLRHKMKRALAHLPGEEGLHWETFVNVCRYMKAISKVNIQIGTKAKKGEIGMKNWVNRASVRA